MKILDRAYRGLTMQTTTRSKTATIGLHQETEKRHAQFRHLLDVAPDGAVGVDRQGYIVMVNPMMETLFGYTPEELIGQPMEFLLPNRHRQSYQVRRQPHRPPMRSRPMAEMPSLTGRRKDGAVFPVAVSLGVPTDGQDGYAVAFIRDKSELKQHEEQLLHQSSHDGLTGLPNRALILERIDSALQRSRRNGLNVALLFVDLDGFKLIKGTYGHEVGNLLLKTVAGRLVEQVRPGDTVARLSGDEFVVFCDQIEQPTAMASLAERINVALRRPVELEGTPLYLTASVGIAIGHGNSCSVDDLLHHADTAMSEAKGKGGDNWQFFSNDLQARAKQRLAITNGLRTAIDNNEFSPRFQPIVAADSGRIVGAELLLRWNPPSGEVSPAVFIPIAEMMGTIVPIGAWVFRQACRAEVDWRRRWGESAPYVSVNVSTRQLNVQTLAEDFAAILNETGADPARLILEITETSLMAEVDASLRILIRLTDLGLRVAVDDFGTGYSSLAQLTRLPVNVLKIDRAFVDGIETSSESRSVVRAVISLGRALGLKLVAEGVETEAQHRELSASGCDFIQGYYFHRPLVESEFIDTVERESRDHSRHTAASLYFLIYVSQVVQSMTAQDLDDLSCKSRVFNRSAGLTGCLVHQDGYFMQMLEGEQKAVAALMEKIKADSRHGQVRVVIEGPSRCRVFTDWGMAMRDLPVAKNGPNFDGWQRRPISFLELADDARLCYAFVTAYAQVGGGG